MPDELEAGSPPPPRRTPRRDAGFLARHRFTLAGGLLLLAVIGGWWGRRSEAGDALPSRPTADFLAPLDMQYREWGNVDLDLLPSEAKQMRPEGLFFRRYESEVTGQEIELAVIAGRRKSTVHTPAYCMPGSGWEILTQEIIRLPVGQETVPANSTLLRGTNGENRLLTFFFTDGRFSTNSISRFQANQLLARFQRRRPVGALVRILTPAPANEAEAEALTADFAKTTLPPLLKAIREAGD